MTISMQRAMFILGHSYGLNGTVGQSILFQGAPGGGKTTLIREFANKYLDGNCVTLEVSRMQGTDLNIPIPDHNKKRVDFYASGDIHDLAESKAGMLFADELTRPSDQGSLSAILNVFLEHRLGKLDFRHCHVWAACNPAAQVGGTELDPAFMNRLVVVNWPEDADPEDYAAHMNALDPVTGKRSGNEWPEAPKDWKAGWADAWTKANQEVTTFLRHRSDLLVEECPPVARPWRSKRSWHSFTNVLAACILHGGTIVETRTLLGGVVGEDTAHAFMAWRANANLPDPKEVIAGKVAVDKLASMDMFLALSVAADLFIANHKKGITQDSGPFSECLLKCADKHMEAVAPICGRLAKARIVDAKMAKLYAKVLPTK